MTPNKIYTVFWKITLLAAAGLLIATFVLAYQSRSLAHTGLYGTLAGSNPSVYLRAEPSGGSQIVTLLERGSTVYVIDTETEQDLSWVKIEYGRYTGWIPEANIVFESQ